LSHLTAGFSIPGTISRGTGNGPPLLNNSSRRMIVGVSSTPTSSTSGEALIDEDYPFENNTFSNTTVPLGDNAFLRCSVKNLGEREVGKEIEIFQVNEY
jgi:hypothetical protein